ncbi:MAG: GIY-YIG catalytic domain protein [Parcubacteria group bacterium GW2011_GWD2_43_10]|nr:MAG: GIY-YIG catalytic domain protein [Parcubacteria group bacterium GW2011_GWA2_42_80]KKS79537.1 MAG: GIY-YIG catalytic domain protein [Parcubacteria group bacterium GW2011_GWD1_42_9]KKS82900.1 MAG: GIY-YIG catalytic domain protein [Parcubacteria group bacterium GW2011_GWD2_43_10]HAO81367.1 hypothetical protein [Candidatus Veblenbacteria bacterium]HBH16888.1 hypothetical protein [Candidatus Veblenbacteria bacterium]
MFYYVYVIQSVREGELYIGRTTDLRKRFSQHNRGSSPSTNRYTPWRPIYYEACLHRLDAERRERYLKTSQGRRLLKRRIKEYLFKSKQFKVLLPG